jgi:hypothetical protein
MPRRSVLWVAAELLLASFEAPPISKQGTRVSSVDEAPVTTLLQFLLFRQNIGVIENTSLRQSLRRLTDRFLRPCFRKRVVAGITFPMWLRR